MRIRPLSDQEIGFDGSDQRHQRLRPFAVVEERFEDGLVIVVCTSHDFATLLHQTRQRSHAVAGNTRVEVLEVPAILVQGSTQSLQRHASEAKVLQPQHLQFGEMSKDLIGKLNVFSGGKQLAKANFLQVQPFQMLEMDLKEELANRASKLDLERSQLRAVLEEMSQIGIREGKMGV